MRHDEQSYWRSRAETQLQLSRSARDDRAIRAHALLAGYYFDRAFRSTGASSSTPSPISGTQVTPLRPVDALFA